MILVLTGTQNIPFRRMLDSIFEFAKFNPDIHFFIQSGPYQPKCSLPNVAVKNFTSTEEMTNLIVGATAVVTHAGTGSIVTSLLNNKKVIVMPRMKKYTEHNDDHQCEIANMFESENLIIHWHENEDFTHTFAKLDAFTPNVYQSGFDSLSRSIESYISSIGL